MRIYKLLLRLPSGAPLIGFLILLGIIFSGAVIVAISLYNKRRARNRTRSLLRKYTIREHVDNKVVGTLRNPIQPPSNSYIKVKLVSKKPAPLKRQRLVYDESMDDKLLSEFVKDNEIHHPHERSQSFEKNQNKDRFLDKFKNSSKGNDKKRLSFNNEDISKIQSENRAEGFGKIEITLQYSISEELLNVALISGKEIHSGDLEDVLKFPAISIQLEGNDESEVTSNPDDAPHPMYDQEFAFPLSVDMLKRGILRFTVRDLLYSHDIRIIGFVRIFLHDYESILLRGEITPLIRGNIIMSLVKQPSYFIGEVLLSLSYDCVTDKVVVNIQRLRNLQISKEDKDVYVKVSILLDNKILLSKKTACFAPSRNISTNKQTFEFNALSDYLDSFPNPQLDLTQELPSYQSKFVKSSTPLNNSSGTDRYIVELNTPDSLKNHMGILLSVRATTSNVTKRVIGRLYIGKTSKAESEEQIHWKEMLKHFDNRITQWHYLKLDRL
ncbi:synaptotagmin-15 isoform X2 [Hydra vulgaris]|uniref:Synaptotagmin-15 isoform X2 n=2 Tax=Hydra vulgaris TaxID=6087 RepID=A0ABM4D8S5_HYDVU